MRRYSLPFARAGDPRPHLALVELWPGEPGGEPRRLGLGTTLCGLALGAGWRALPPKLDSVEDYLALCPACRANLPRRVT